jgi:hypothetical protein
MKVNSVSCAWAFFLLLTMPSLADTASAPAAAAGATSESASPLPALSFGEIQSLIRKIRAIPKWQKTNRSDVSPAQKIWLEELSPAIKHYVRSRSRLPASEVNQLVAAAGMGTVLEGSIDPGDMVAPIKKRQPKDYKAALSRLPSSQRKILDRLVELSLNPPKDG